MERRPGMYERNITIADIQMDVLFWPEVAILFCTSAISCFVKSSLLFVTSIN
jgi:hypothetical protein